MTALAKRNKPLSKKHNLRATQMLQQAWASHQAGKLQVAEASCLSILNKYPNYPDAILLLGLIAQQVGRFDLAIARFQQALAIKPNYPDAHYNLGNTLQMLSRLEEAIDCFNQTLICNPNFAMAHNNLGIIYIELERLEEAIAQFNKAIAIKPDYALAHNNIGNALKNLGRNSEAIIHFEKALLIDPDYVDAHNNFGTLLQDMGQKDDAIKHYEMALTLKPDFAAVHYNLSKIDPKQEQIPFIKRLLASPTIAEEDAMNFHYTLGNIYNHIKSYSDEFEHFIKGNALKRKTLIYDSTKHSAFVESLIDFFSENYFKEKAIYGSDSELPVFILGMPRSGTTLVEQIVSSHPQVYGADELDKIRLMETAIAKQFETVTPYPACMSLLDESTLQKFATEYLQKLRSYSKEATRITDKMPSNFLHIGFIKMLFPNARIIHCRRHPLDTCTSIILNNFASGNEYTYDLIEIGKFYLDYERLMTHWHKVFPNKIFDVQYEELISNQENISLQLINYLGLDWDEACLAFHNNDRAVRTASNLQVRQPVYNKSINRWKNYEEHLQPLIETLQPILE